MYWYFSILIVWNLMRIEILEGFDVLVVFIEIFVWNEPVVL